jgi:hypothetical protein
MPQRLICDRCCKLCRRHFIQPCRLNERNGSRDDFSTPLVVVTFFEFGKHLPKEHAPGIISTLVFKDHSTGDACFVGVQFNHQAIQALSRCTDVRRLQEAGRVSLARNEPGDCFEDESITLPSWVATAWLFWRLLDGQLDFGFRSKLGSVYLGVGRRHS